MSIAVPVTQPKGGQFVLHAKALHTGHPFDGHTLTGAVADVERNTGVEVRRIHVDKGYRGHDCPTASASLSAARATAAIKREMKRRAAVEPVIGHVKADHRGDRNYLKGQDGDRINAVLAAAGFNFRLLLMWLAALLRAISWPPSSRSSDLSQPDPSRREELCGRLLNGVAGGRFISCPSPSYVQPSSRTAAQLQQPSRDQLKGEATSGKPCGILCTRYDMPVVERDSFPLHACMKIVDSCTLVHMG